MRIVDFLTKDRIIFGLKSEKKEDIIKEMAHLFLESGDVINDGMFDVFVEDLIERENLTSTGMQDGIAIPHAKSPAINKLALALAIVPEGRDFDSFDEEPSKLFFMIAAPEDTKKEHLDLLQKISKLSYEEDILEKIISTKDTIEVIKLLGLI
ncbi:PTS sugar transporter subunit IIA [Streptobacillus felis]|uniref:PTS sugar transporter subunit IIA n=1 Tax=Streptobacillus felis TaxID=1384509 RepID=A0A7Z0PGB8_9FUSO|nr:PTS sugar transporter subunit IIA [Streptobacillus felis]NYV28188.1 PTS sugar transporter subunit IIA [Streptobacillus felis]